MQDMSPRICFRGTKYEIYREHVAYFIYSGIPISRTSRGNANWFDKSGVKLQCSTEERERLLVRVIGRFEKMRVREIGISL